MTIDEEFRPDEFRIEEEDSGQFRVVWERDNGERRVVVLDRTQLPAVLQELQKQIEPGSVAPTDLQDLLSGSVAQVAGLGFAPEPDHFRLTAFVEVPEHEKGVAISLRLSKADLMKCVSAMTQWLEQHREDG
jgi:hypothetical protein